MRISLVTPLYRSAQYIEELYTRSVEAVKSITPDYEIVFVNDASPDESLAIAKRIADQDQRVTVVDLSRNFGQHRSLITGIRMATGDYVYICDSDLEEEPEWIGLFYNRLRSTECDVAFGTMSNQKGSAPYRTVRRLFYYLLRALSDASIPENVTTARLMSRRYVDAFLKYGEREVFLIGIWHMVGFDQVAIPVTKVDRSPTTYTVGKLMALFLNGIIAFSVRPLILIALTGAFLLCASAAIALWALFNYASGGVLPGYTSLVLALTSMTGLIVLFNGIIAIYVAKIYLEVKARPLTTIREIYSKGTTNAVESAPSAARHSMSSETS